MKSRKLRAAFAVLSALAVLATAMTGFAATVTTTTEYNAFNDYVHVTSTVTGANGDVTYLATTSSDKGVDSTGILYIDQKASENGSVTFDYMVSKDVIDGAITTLALGTNGTETITQPDDGIGLYAPAGVDATEYTIDYANDVYGNADDGIYAYIKAKLGYEIESVTIDGADQDLGASYYVPVKDNGELAVIVVETKESVVTPSVGDTKNFIDVEDGKNTVATVIKPVGSWQRAGITYYGYDFPALQSANGNGYVAVKIIDDAPIVESQIVAYVE